MCALCVQGGEWRASRKVQGCARNAGGGGRGGEEWEWRGKLHSNRRRKQANGIARRKGDCWVWQQRWVGERAANVNAAVKSKMGAPCLISAAAERERAQGRAPRRAHQREQGRGWVGSKGAIRAPPPPPLPGSASAAAASKAAAGRPAGQARKRPLKSWQTPPLPRPAPRRSRGRRRGRRQRQRRRRAARPPPARAAAWRSRTALAAAAA